MEDQIFAWAEQAVAGVALRIDPDLADVWMEVSPEAMGLDGDHWLAVSKEMVKEFNLLAGTGIHISDPARLQYRPRDLIDFVGAIADAAGQVP